MVMTLHDKPIKFSKTSNDCKWLLNFTRYSISHANIPWCLFKLCYVISQEVSRTQIFKNHRQLIMAPDTDPSAFMLKSHLSG